MSSVYKQSSSDDLFGTASFGGGGGGGSSDYAVDNHYDRNQARIGTDPTLPGYNPPEFNQNLNNLDLNGNGSAVDDALLGVAIVGAISGSAAVTVTALVGSHFID